MDAQVEQNQYVIQLKEVFNSCDLTGCGNLDKTGLSRLCQRLQLEDQSTFLINRLLKNNTRGLVNFDEFKDCFVALLAQSAYIEDSEPVDTVGVSSEEREVSPKYVHGNKKYGRRSRPESDELNDSENDLPSDYYSDLEVFFNDASNQSAGDSKAIHSNEIDSISASKKEISQLSLRKRRRTSLEDESNADDLNCIIDDDTESNYLQTIWQKLAVGESGFLMLEELERVCQHIGMENVSREVVSQLFAKLDMDQDGKISFQEFLHLFENGEANTGGSHSSSNNSTPQHVASGWKHNLESEEECSDARANSISESGMFTSIDTEHDGYVTPESIADYWDSLGFPNGVQILKDLGFNSPVRISLLDLSSSLEECLTSSEDSFLHQVAIVTVQHEFKYIKNALDQMKKERDKLKTDVAEANLRAAMLAQEVDDQNAKLEKSSQNKIIVMEKKYREQVQSLQEELSQEREQLAVQVTKAQQNLQDELLHLRQEDISLKDQIINLQAENDRFDHEIRELTDKLNESQKLNQHQVNELESMASIRQRLEEFESGHAFLQEQEQEKLLIELQSLKLENQALRDQNDELALQLESLRQQVSSRPSAKPASHKRNGSSLGEYVRPAAVKRRGDGRESPVNCDDGNYSLSPRLGKIHCKNQETDPLEKELGQDNWKVDTGSEDGDYQEDKMYGPSWRNNDTCVDSNETRRIKEKNLVPMSASGEMKQVFIYLRNSMAAEHLNEVNSSINNEKFQERLDEAEWERDNLTYQLEALEKKHEDEIRSLRAMWDDRLRNELELTTTKHNMVDTGIQTEIRGTVEKCHRLRARLDVAMNELEMALVREAQGDEILFAFEQKYKYLREKLVYDLKAEQEYDMAGGDSGPLNVKLPADVRNYQAVHISSNLMQLIVEEILRPVESVESNAINKELVMMVLNFLFRTRELVKMGSQNAEYFCGTELISRSSYLTTIEVSCKNLQMCLSELHSKEMAGMKDCNVATEQIQELKIKCSEYEEKLRERNKCCVSAEHMEAEWKEKVEDLTCQHRTNEQEWKNKLSILEAQLEGVATSVKLGEAKDEGIDRVKLFEKEIQTDETVQTLEAERMQLSEHCRQLQELKCSLEKEFSDFSKELENNFDSNLPISDQDLCCSDFSSLSVQTQSTDLDKISEQNLLLSDITSENQPNKSMEEGNCIVGVDMIHNLSQRLRKLERRCNFLEESAKMQTLKAEQKLKSTNQQHNKDVCQLKELLSNTQSMLKQQATDYESQLEISDNLVKNLYVENGQLMKALQVTEERQKKAEQLSIHLHDKCQALTELAANIYKTAIS